MYTRLSRLRVLAGASIFAALALALAMPSVMGQPSGSATVRLGSLLATPSASASVSATSSPSTPQSTPTPKSAVSLSTADKCATPPTQTGRPYIEFCAPSFRDPGGANNIEGPDGSHVTFVIDNMGHPVQQIYLFAVSPSAQKECATIGSAGLTFDNGSEPAVDTLVNPQNHGPVILTFTWTFGKNVFDITSDYCLAAKFNRQDPVASSTGFSLLSGAPPCVSVSTSGAPSACAQSSSANQDIQALAGSTIQVAGSGWVPGNVQQQIAMTLVCAPGVQCSKSDYSLRSLSTSGADARDSGGDIGPDPIKLPSDAAGKFQLHASAANGAISFGDTSSGDTQSITITIVAHPCIEIGVGCVWDGSNMPTPVAQAKSATIMLQNWKSGDKVSVFIVPSVKSAQDCNASKPLGAAQSLTPSSSAVGQSFALPSSLKVNQNYTICAVGHSALGGDTVSAAIQVKITKPVAHPLFSMMSLLALLFGLVGVGAYIMATRERAVTVPQPVVRR